MIFTVVKSPSDALSMTNEVYMHAKDAEKMSSDADTPFYVKDATYPRVYLCKVHESVREGTVAMSRTQRGECCALLDDAIALELFIPSANNSIECLQLNVTVDLVDTPQKPVLMDTKYLQAHFTSEFKDHYFLIGQNIITKYEGIKFRFAIQDYYVSVRDMSLCAGRPFCRSPRCEPLVFVIPANNPMLLSSYKQVRGIHPHLGACTSPKIE